MKFWVQATLNKLSAKQNFMSLSLYKLGEGGYNWNSYFQSSKDINNYQYKKAEVILPKVYETAYNLNGISMYEVDKQGANFFRNRLNQTYNNKYNNTNVIARLKK